SGEQATAIVSPWSDWAYAYAPARLRAGLATDYEGALTDALGRFRAHTEFDFWTVVPRTMSDGDVGAWNNAVQAGVLLSGLSELTAEMASGSHLSPAGLSSIALVEAVRADLTDAGAVLDGQGPRGALDVGTCATICALGPLTLRGDLQEAADT